MTTLPKGYRWVRVGEIVRWGDQFFHEGEWRLTGSVDQPCTYRKLYRRIRTTKKGRKKK